MTILPATALTGGFVAAIATYLFLQFPGLFVWAAFIGWAAYANNASTEMPLPRVVAALSFGVLIAWIIALLIASVGTTIPVPLLAGTLVGLATVIIVMFSSFAILSLVPAVFYGFAASFAYLTQAPNALTITAMTSVTLANVVIVVGVSLVIGAALGQIHSLLASRLNSSN